jgi:hypothetical protein
MSLYLKYRIDKENKKFVVRQFTGFDHHWAEYSEPIASFDTKKEAENYVQEILLAESEQE